MSYTLKTQQIAVKDPDTGTYSGVDVLTEQTKSGLLAEIQAEGATQRTSVTNTGAAQVSAVQTKGAETLASIPSDYTTLSNDVDDLKNTFVTEECFNRNIKNGYYDPSTFEFTEHSNTHTSVLSVGNASRVIVKDIIVNSTTVDIFFSDDELHAKGQHWAINIFASFEVFVPKDATKCYIQFGASTQTSLKAYMVMKDAEAKYIANDYAKYVSMDYTSDAESCVVLQDIKWNSTNKKFIAQAGMKSIYTRVEAGERFAIFSNTWRTNYYAYMFLDDSFNILSYGNTTFYYNGWVITAPLNATMLIVNGDSANYNINIRKITGDNVPYYTKSIIYNKCFRRGLDVQYQNLTGYIIIASAIGNAEKAMISANRYLSNYYGYTFYNASLEVVGEQPQPGRIENEIVTIPETAVYVVVTGDTVAGEVRLDFGTELELQELKKSYEKISESELAEDVKKLNKWYGKKIVWFGTSIPAGRVNNVAGTSYPEIVGKKLGAIVYNEAIPSSMIRTGLPENPLICKVLSLSATHEEKEAQSWYASLSDADKTRAYNSSLDILFDKYLSSGSVGSVDLYVFDHAYNDVIPNDHNDLLIEPTDEYDKRYFYGAANFLINRILTDNPRAKIVWIGHYEDQLNNEGTKQNRGVVVSQAQKHVADKWSIPICELWDYLGWSGQTIETTGYWSNGTSPGTWVPSGGTLTEMYIKDCQFPDGIHPHTDNSGESTNKIANVLADFLESLS